MSQLQTQTKTIEVDSAQILAEAIAAHDARVKERTHVPMVDGALKPDSMDGLQRVGTMYLTAKMFNDSVQNVAQASIVLEAGYSVGMSGPQAAQNIYLVGNKPTMYGEACVALCQRNRKEWRGMDIKFDGLKDDGTPGDSASCRVTMRRALSDGTIETAEGFFSVGMAKAAGLWANNNWRKYPVDQLKWKAFHRASKMLYADVLKGIGIREEVEDYDARPSKNATPDSIEDMKATIASLPQRKMPESGGGSAVAPDDAPAPARADQADKPFDPADISEQMDAALAKRGE